MKFIQQLSESHLLSSKASYRKYTARQIAELVYLHIIGLRILADEDLTRHWAASYGMRSSRYVGFAKWYQNATDLHLLLHALIDEDVDLKMPEASQEFKETLYFEPADIMRWLKDMANGHVNPARTRQLFMRLDGQFRIRDSSMKAIRRLAQDWPHLTYHQKKLAMTRLLQIMRVRCRMSDVLERLENVADHLDLEMHNVANKETGDEPRDQDNHEVVHHEEPKKKFGFGKTVAAVGAGMLGYTVLSKLLGEDADAGVTASGDVASVVAPLGAVQRRIPRVPRKKKRKAKR